MWVIDAGSDPSHDPPLSFRRCWAAEMHLGTGTSCGSNLPREKACNGKLCGWTLRGSAGRLSQPLWCAKLVQPMRWGAMILRNSLERCCRFQFAFLCVIL